MRCDDVAAFARRDWGVLAASKDDQWLAERGRRGIAWCIEIADELRRQVTDQRPDWPSVQEREDDLAVHARVTEALRRVNRAGSR